MRSIFAKILIAGLTIAIITALALSFILSTMFAGYFYGEHKTNLEKSLGEAESLTSKHTRGQIQLSGYRRSMQAIENLENTHFIVIGKDGRTLVDSSRRLVAQPTRNELFKLARSVHPGGRITKQIDDPQDPSLDILLISVSRPDGSILAFSHVVDVRDPLHDIIRLVWIAAAVALVVSIPPAYLISRHLTTPLIKMNEAAQKMSKGDFGTHIDLVRRDEIGQLARSLDYMATQLDTLERLRQDFLANVSHELRTPLTSIRGFVQGILDGTIRPDDQPAYLARVYAEASRLSRITDDLLMLARLKDGSIKFNWSEADPASVLSDVVEMLEPQATDKDITLRLEAGSVGRLLRTDRNRLAQIYMNVISNAIKFSPVGGRIDVDAGWEIHGFNITISDEGPGIPEDDLPFIFDRFYTGQHTTDREYMGTGLGLAISKLLVDKHNGTIAARNRNGKGSEFAILFPG